MTQRFVYFMRQVGGVGPIKIGCSSVPQDRLQALSVWSPLPLELLFIMPGDFKLEQKIHARFADTHSHHEWFEPSSDLLMAVEMLKAGAPLEMAIDFTVEATRPIRAATPKHSPERRRYLSYAHRLRWAERKAPPYTRAPKRADDIMAAWAGYGGAPGQEPADADIAYLEAVLADPAAHLVHVTVRFPNMFKRAS